MSKFLIFLMVIFAASSTYATVNFPFPQSSGYANGIIASNVDNADLKSDFETWWKAFYEESGDLGRIKWDTKGETVSEGIGYGMLLAVYMSDKTTNYESEFKKLWAYYKKFSNSNGVMNWHVSGFSSVKGQNGATDAELDVALALVMAHYQFGEASYLADAKTLIDAIQKHELTSGKILKPGDAWDTQFNPSYMSMGALGIFKEVDSGDASTWQSALDANYTLLLKNQNKTTKKLPSDWCDASGNLIAHWDGLKKHGYDAARTSWRVVMGYYWFGHSDAKTFFNDFISGYSNNLAATAVVDGVALDNGGGNGQYNNSTFVGSMGIPFGVSSTHQTKLNSYYSHLSGTVFNSDKGSYYNGSLNILYRLAMSGNMVNMTSGTVTPPEPNNAPVITSQKNDITVEQGKTVTIKLSDLNTTDADGDALSLEVQSGTNYTKSGNAVTVSSSFKGDLTVKVKVTDGTDYSVAFNMTVTVTEAVVTPNRAPVINSQVNNSLTVETGKELTIKLSDINATDADGDALTLEVQGGIDYTYSGNTITSASGYTGDLLVNIKVTDGIDYSNEFSITVKVTEEISNPIEPTEGIPTINNATYKYFSTSGNDAPDFTGVNSISVSWSSEGNTLNTFSGSFSGEPYYFNFKDIISQTWQTDGKITFEGSNGIDGLDGTYTTTMLSSGGLLFINVNTSEYFAMYTSEPTDEDKQEEVDIVEGGTAVNEMVLFNDENLVVAPNPVKDNAVIIYNIDEASVVQVNIYSSTEKLVSTFKHVGENGKNIINSSIFKKLRAGVYFIEVVQKGERVSMNSFTKVK